MLEHILDLIRKNRTATNVMLNTYKFILKLFLIEPHLRVNHQSEEASELIKKYLSSDSPCMICRYGNTELRTAIGYLNELEKVTVFKRYVRRLFEQEPVSLNGWILDEIVNLSGFFPKDRNKIIRFVEELLNLSKNIDVLCTWKLGEKRLLKYLPETLDVIKLNNLQPWIYEKPWTKALEGKKILIVHPFVDTIKKQYAIRKKLFNNLDILPDFKLETVKAVQSRAGNRTEFGSWFDALDHMKKEIDKIDFDIAIIGAGAYGIFLAGHVKNRGKKAVHMGGVTQLLFGIKGNRWDNSEFANKYYNQYWVRPSKDETIKIKEKIKEGSYW